MSNRSDKRRVPLPAPPSTSQAPEAASQPLVTIWWAYLSATGATFLSTVTGDAVDMAAPDGPPPELSIVIPAFNEERRIGVCLGSLARQDIDVTYEVVLVDNHSTPLTQRCASLVQQQVV